MRWPSLDAARSAAADSLKRFPLPLLCAWIAAALSARQVIFEGNHPSLTAAIFAAALGIPLLFALALLFERLDARAAPSSKLPRRVIELACLAALGLIAWLWPEWSDATQIRRYAQLSLFAHALAAFLPYLIVRESNGFWQYNRVLLIRLIVASIFSGVLLFGLEGALISLKPLFNIQVSPKVYLVLMSTVSFVFHPWFFLAGIPRDLATLEERTDYPAVIKIFAQFILIPLVAVYQALLTAYLVKVIVTGQWPSGLIGWLVSAEAILGILAILLIHPVRALAENRWIRTFARVFYIALVPSIVMLALSIGKRIGQHGVTEDRYFVVVLTGWLAFVSVYFGVRRDGDIRIIPITLAALALLTFAGPWSAYAISRGSQCARLTHVLATNGMIDHGRVVPAARPVPASAEKELSSILDYLLKTHGTRPVRRVMGDLAAAADSARTGQNRGYGEQATRRILARLGLHYVGSWETTMAKMYSYDRPYGAAPEAERVTPFEFHVHIDRAPPAKFVVEGVTCELRLDAKERRLVLMAGNDSLDTFSLERALTGADQASSLPDSLNRGLRIEGSSGVPPAVLLISQISGIRGPDLTTSGLVAELYFSLHRP
jgi:Domain of unknown function (DUF4153)